MDISWYDSEGSDASMSALRSDSIPSSKNGIKSVYSDCVQGKESCEMNTKEKIKASRKKLDDGIVLWKVGKYERASKRFKQAVKIIEDGTSFSDDEKKDVRDLKSSCGVHISKCDAMLLYDQQLMKSYEEHRNQGFSDYDRVHFGSVQPSLMPSLDTTSSFTGWNSLSHERSYTMCYFYHVPIFPSITFSFFNLYFYLYPLTIKFAKRLSQILHQGLNVDWQRAPTVSNSHIVKKMLRLDIPHDNHPTGRYLKHYINALSIIRNHRRATQTCGISIFQLL
ncbi:transmembrane protein, putative [Medicago truncatula]|uniref:Transmembrane protein, putative n=1 Tax=Medicago truncatula TaxID=3880 RepID=A0A072UPL2_MEDTR|nr:transmembrane protein, putative [Medicago truncatula]KEH33930.1 transmembrane protein, putative [Medicago truncatula]